MLVLLFLDPPTFTSYFLGSVVMTAGVVAPIAYLIYKNANPSHAAIHYQ